VLATTIDFQLMRDWGASTTGTYAFVSPVIAVVLRMTLFGEHADWSDLARILLMLAAGG
jgi:hypothetical protein